MDNAYGKGRNSRPEPANTVQVKIPKNIRQIGNPNSRNKIIYVEDYVMTFIKQLSERDPGGCRAAILLGYYARTQECKNIFVKGAIEMKNIDFSTGVNLTDEGWTGIYENIKKYFTDVEIVGWALTGPDFYLDGMEKIKKVHISNFAGSDKTLLKLDSMEKEENFYVSENNQLLLLDGYYIYYEKNEEMQNYMVENKAEDTREETPYDDQTTRKIRSIIKEKKEVKEDRNVVRLLYAASSLLAIIVLVIAATMLENYDKMKNMEAALNTISQSLSADNSENPSPNDTQETMSHGVKEMTPTPVNENTETDEDFNVETNEDLNSEDSDSLNVETISGAIGENGIDEDKDKDKEEAQSEDITEKSTDNSKEQEKKEITPEATKEKEKEKEKAVKTDAPIRYYTVEAGDSLAGISYKLYETYAYMDKIKELNGIEDENMVYTGQKLRVP